MTEKMPKGSDLKGESRAVPPAQPSPAKPGAGPALDLDELDRLEKAATPPPWGCGGGHYLPITATRNRLHCQIGRAESCGYHNLPSEEIEANGGLISEGRNAIPQLIAIARAARDAVELQLGCSAHFTAFITAMDRLRAALGPRAGATPASGDGSIGKQEKSND